MKANEIYNRVLNSYQSSFVLNIEKYDDKIILRMPLYKIVQITYNKDNNNIYSIIMWNDTTNASRRFAKTIENIKNKTPNDVVTEIFNYLNLN